MVRGIGCADNGNRTEFAYDGMGRRVKIIEYSQVRSATIEPESSRYEMFPTTPFSVPAGNYTLLFQGLNANGGENAALIDAITLDGVLIPDGSFESPVVADYQYRPSNTAWTYGGSAGVTANGGTFTNSSGDAPDENQVAFVEKRGSLKQTFAIASGNHMLSFQVAQAESVHSSSQQLRVSLLGPPTSAKSFVWSGNTIAEERDSSGANVKKRFFAEGEQRVGGGDAGNYYYTRDHLGSIREVTDSTGALKARYDYDAWGKSVVVSGNMNVDFGYTGHYRHAASDLYLAMYRAYDPSLGRWLSRDPIAEKGGLNLYGYVDNDPVEFVDHDGKNLVVAGVVIAAVAITVTAWKFYAILHVTKKAGDAYGERLEGCNNILRDPNNMEQHADAVQDATKRLDGHLRQLAVEAGTEAATGPFVEAVHVP